MASTPHRATAEQWQRVEAIALLTTSGPSVPAAVLELRSRIEALEAQLVRGQDAVQVAVQVPVPAPTSSLVERVADALYNVPRDSEIEARAAIRAVAAWLRDTQGWAVAPALLESAASEGSQEGAA